MEIQGHREIREKISILFLQESTQVTSIKVYGQFLNRLCGEIRK